MKITQAILTAWLTISLAGCVIQGKPKAVTPPAPQPVVAAPAPPPPPPPQLSMPQTQVQLPPPQPIDLEALAPARPAEPPAESPPAGRSTRPRPRPPAAPANATPEPPAAAPATPAETERGPVQEMLSDAEKARLKNNADGQKRSVRVWLNSNRGRRLKTNDPTVARIQLLLKASDEAEGKGDMREASDLADRAVVFMRELQSGR